MLREHKKTILILCSGLILGWMAGHFRVKMRFNPAGGEAEPAVFHEETFAQASSIDSALILAQQLPLADAQKCAALAQEMLTKRVRVLVMEDPFADKSAEKYEEKPLPTHAWEGLFKRWFQVAPEAAWAFVMAHHRDDELPLREAALHQWALLDPLAAVKAAGETIKKEERHVILNACIENHPSTGLQLLLEWGMKDDLTDDDPFSSRPEFASELLSQLAEKSPQEALEWCKAHKPDELDAVCVGWVRHDLDACLDWIATQEVSEQKDLLASLCEEADVSVKTVRVLASMCEPAEVLSWVGDAFNQIVKRDEAMAQALIDELLPNPMDRMLARCSMADDLMRSDPRKAMAIMLPSLRTALPLYEQPSPHLQSCFPSHDFNDGPDYYGVTHIFENYLQLGPAAGVGKAEALALLQEIHPQYHPLLIGENTDTLRELLGPPGEWAFPLLRDMPREQMNEVVENLFSSASPDELWKQVKSLTPGTLRDVMSERCLTLMIEDDAPVDVVMAFAQQHGGTRLDLSVVYESWVGTAPDQALRHLQANPDAKPSEWAALIAYGYGERAEEIQNAVERMPAGALRQAAVKSLSYQALEQASDLVTSLYWATEISDTAKRYKQLKDIHARWQNDPKTRNDPQIAEALRQNLEHSSLDAREKALWRERWESEVAR